ncbi:tetratricopeptide repeat-containing sensor histidine kinase [Pseudoalteromonas luteoviolacea]|uniref:tetratricopeptide repeat-containing sensor histidine kinase n=1 Tax=Pseudoalteromonas luteoviolacea TaxID=43657 RepID=UPI00115044B5|nr:tetratricopeptide repeat-containing sensor histidine kinase [Pseudoalteromonas luteoviolacea]TQF70216.1 sensor histidine kinase [Pseudoalteromonas luteoviolacea]
MLLRCAILVCTLITANTFAMPITEAEFEKLRAEIRQASAQSPLQAIDTTDDILRQNDSQLSTRQKIRLLYGKAWFQIQTDDVHSAISTLSVCKKMSIEVSDPTILYSYYSLTAGALTRMSLYERALENYLESYRLAALMETDMFLRQTENNIGNVYLKLSRFEDAKSYFERFYQDAKERNLPQQMGVGLNNLGEAYFGLGNFKKALSLHLESLKIREANNLTYHSSWSHYNLGRTYLALDNTELAKHHLTEAINIRKQSNAIADSIAPQIELMKLKALTGDTKDLEIMLYDVISLSNEHSRFQEKTHAYQLLVDYFSKKQDWKNSFMTAQQLMQTKFDFLQRQAEIGVAFYAAQMNLAIKERDIAQLTQENELHQINTQAAKNQLILVLVGVLIIALLTLFFVRRINAKNLTLIETLENLKATQKQLLESEKMSAMTTLVSGMAHQLNTPLGLVVTSASCLEAKLKEIHDLLNDQKLSAKQLKKFLEESSEMLEMTANNSGRAADLIARFKMIAASLDSSEAVKFDVLTYLKNRSELITQSLDKNIEIDVYGQSIQVHSHPEALLKVISQLVNNSCSHGFISQSSGRIMIEVREDRDWAVITYQDDGVGINEAEQQQIFEPFYTSQLGQGKLGLGLNIAYNSVVQVLKGKISYEHQDCGAKFVVKIPKQTE